MGVMLFNPLWKTPAKIAAPPSLRGLVAWLETKDPATRYVWERYDHCLIGRYLHETTGEREPWSRIEYADVVGGDGPYGRVAYVEPHTYGAALARAKQELTTRNAAVAISAVT
jgi:hypothetical protein